MKKRNEISSTSFISGTFIQIDHWDNTESRRFQTALRSMTPEDWAQMLKDMTQIGIDTLVFQQGVDCRQGWENPLAYYPSKRWSSPSWMKGDSYSAIVQSADQLGMKIYHSFGTMFSLDPEQATGQIVERIKIIANELLELYGNSPSFAGWYWSHEYSPATLPGRDSLRKIIPEVRKLSDCDIMIAPNADRGICCSVLNDINVDIIAYQDTVGLGVEPDKFGRFATADRFQSLARLPYLYQQLSIAHDGWHAANGTEKNYWNCYSRERGRTAIWNDLEVWEFDCQGGLFPTELSRIVAQLDLTAPFVDKQIIYQYPGFLCHPDHPRHVGGERAATLYEDYAFYRNARLKRMNQLQEQQKPLISG